MFSLSRSYGVLVWEVATYGETPHEQIPTSNIVEMADNGSLRLERYTLTILYCSFCTLFCMQPSWMSRGLD